MNLFILLYMIGFIRTLFVILIIYFGIRLLVRYVFPMLLDRGLKNMQQKMQNQQRGTRKPSRPEGEVTIQGKPKPGHKDDRREGDYIDFEEVD